MTNIIAIAVIAAILGFAGWYVYKSWKSGKKCVSCPCNGSCGSDCCQNSGK